MNHKKNAVQVVRTEDGRIVEGAPEAIAEYKKQRELEEDLDKRRREIWPHNSDTGYLNTLAAMSVLAEMFPGLRGRPGTEPWDALKLLRYLCTGGGSHGEKLSARFLLGIWNSNDDWVAVAKEEGIENPEAAKHHFGREKRAYALRTRGRARRPDCLQTIQRRRYTREANPMICADFGA